MTGAAKKGVPPPPPTGRSGHSAEDDLVLKQIGSRLKIARRALNLKRVQMADYLGMSESMYKKYEQGQYFMKPSQFQKLAMLGVNMQFLMVGVGDMFDNGRPLNIPA